MAKRRFVPKKTESEIRRIVRTNMRNRRVSLGMSQLKLAKSVGVSQAFISAIESPNRPEDVPSLEFLERLAEALASSVAALVTDGMFRLSEEEEEQERRKPRAFTKARVRR